MAKKEIIQAKKINYEIFITFLTFLSWVNGYIILFSSDENARILTFWVELLLTPIFLIDFLVHLRRSRPRRSYFFSEYGWLELVGSFPFLRWLRLYRVYRVIYYLRRRDGMSLLKEFFANRGETAVLTLSLAVILLFEFASIAILRAEAVDVNANITTPGDAVWWLMVTIATVGYGDSYPVTARGRLIASLVIVAGVGLFGILSGFLARTFLGSSVGESRAAIDQNKLTTSHHLATLLTEVQAVRQEQAQLKEAQGDHSRRLEERLIRLEELFTNLDRENGR